MPAGVRSESAVRPIGTERRIEQAWKVVSDRSERAAHFRTHILAAYCLQIVKEVALKH